MSALSQRIEPFRGLLYDSGVAGDIATLVAPPYDLIGEARQRELYQRSPFNIVRLELNREPDPYGAAASTLAEWLAIGALKRARTPAIYLYTQSFEIERRRLSRHGFIVRIRLEEFGRGRILPHERTFAAPKEDRLRLLTAIRTNTSPIFSLYSGEHPELDRLREQVSARAPLIDATDDLKIRNELRAIDFPAEIAVVQRALAAPRVLIADGHHRYETALNYRRERRSRENPPEERGFDYTMMTLVACDDPGLVILPTHRVARTLRADALAGFASRAREMFEVEEFGDRDAMRARLGAAGRGALGVALSGHDRLYILELKEGAAADAAMANLAPELRDLDVSLLHALVFERILSLSAAEIGKGGIVDYTVDAAGALDAVRDGRAAGAFLMNPPSIRDLERVTDAGATMPEKSTYFYPKLLTGLVMNPLDD
ncbi:MAG TPA: DUF1015 domain-containing protein [Candidatus Binataceae bacterium]|nr:DUF1015 domain-containing protein [Candidatus Binataceae bacterium]